MVRNLLSVTVGVAAVVLLAVPPASVQAQGKGPPAGGKNQQAAPPTTAEAIKAIKLPEKPPEPSPYITEPKTPDELLGAVLQMLDIARPQLAKNYFDRLLELELTDEIVQQLRDNFGPAPFVRLLNTAELKPAVNAFVERVNRLNERKYRDPFYIEKLILQLKGKSEERAQALTELESAGPLAAPYLLRVIQMQNQELEDSATQILVKMGRRGAPVLVAALESADTRFRAHVAGILGYTGDTDAVAYLWHPAFSADEPAPVKVAARQSLARLLRVPAQELGTLSSSGIVARLLKMVRQNFRQENRLEPDASGNVLFWQWDAQKSLVTSLRLKPQEAADILGLRLARHALHMAPDFRETQVAFLATALTRDLQGLAWNMPYRTGPGTAHDLALTAGAEVVGDVVQFSLQSGRPLTAVAALKALEQIGTPDQLRGTTARNTPFLNALNYPDTRVQFAAAAAILQVDPTTSFLGASRVVAVLRRALATDQLARVVVARPDPEQGAVTGGLFSQLGYAPSVVTTGKECFRLAAERSDVQLIVLSPMVVDWPLAQTLANLRADSRTALIPIVIYGTPNAIKDLQVPTMIHLEGKTAVEQRGDIASRMHTVVANYPLTTFVFESQTREQLELQVNPFLQNLKAPPLTAPQRAQMKAAAIGWMAHIASGRRQHIFNLAGAESELAANVPDPNFAVDALQALGEIRTNVAQERLADLALQSILDPRVREIALNKLAFHIQRYGLLIDAEKVRKLHAAADSVSDVSLRSAYAVLIGTLKPNAKLVGERLRAYQTTVEAVP